jgi:hypothetical protein
MRFARGGPSSWNRANFQMTTEERYVVGTALRASAQGLPIYASALRQSASQWAQLPGQASAELAELCRETALKLDQVAAEFDKSLTEFSNGQ